MRRYRRGVTMMVVTESEAESVTHIGAEQRVSASNLGSAAAKLTSPQPREQTRVTRLAQLLVRLGVTEAHNLIRAEMGSKTLQ